MIIFKKQRDGLLSTFKLLNIQSRLGLIQYRGYQNNNNNGYNSYIPQNNWAQQSSSKKYPPSEFTKFNEQVRSNLRRMDSNYQSSQSDSEIKEYEDETSRRSSYGGIQMSKYYEIRPQEILNFLSTHKIKFKENSKDYTLQYCPMCNKPHNNEYDNMYTMNILKQIGNYKCFRCGSSGNWFDFKNKVMLKFYGKSLNELVGDTSNINQSFMPQNEEERNNNAKYEVSKAYNYFIQMQKDLYPEINRYLTTLEEPSFRGISKEVLEVYKIGVGKEKFRNDLDQLSWFDAVYYPLYAPRSKKSKAQSAINQTEEEKVINTSQYELVKMKVRAIGADNKSKQKFMPSGSELKGLFGLTTVGENDKSIVITEGEFDAMAVYQETGIPAVSLPNGANHLPIAFLPFLDRFERIYLWMDADEAGRNSAEKFASKLGSKRTLIIDSRMQDSNGPKDANDALRQGLNFKEIFETCSRTLGDKNLLSFSDIKEKVMNRILNYTELSGIQSKYFTFYNRTLKGFRRGELTLITGATGSGKTTFLSQLSLDFLSQGVPTLWGSFEIRNEILAQAMLQQYSRKKLTDGNEERLDLMMEKFEQNPLYFMNFYGSTPIDLMFETLDYAIYAYDIQLICIDNMQFMLSQQAAGPQKFELQDMVASRLRQLASDHNVHVCVIIHPKKVEDDNNLTVGSIFGTAKISQEADSIMILQKNNMQNYRILQVKKNRFDGEVGEVSMLFNPENKRYFEITAEEKQKMLLSHGNYKAIIKERLAKYGTVEPEEKTSEIDLKVIREGGGLVIPPATKGNKTLQLAKQDLEFYSKLRQHSSEPIENDLNTKDRHLFYSTDQEKPQEDDISIDPLSSFMIDQLDDDSQQNLNEEQPMENVVNDLSIDQAELDQMMIQKQALQIQPNKEEDQAEAQRQENIKRHYQQLQEQSLSSTSTVVKKYYQKNNQELDLRNFVKQEQRFEIKQSTPSQPQKLSVQEFRYTMNEGESHSEHPESVLKEMRISSEVYAPIHKRIRPQWAPKIDFIESFYDSDFKKPFMSTRRKIELGIKEEEIKDEGQERSNHIKFKSNIKEDIVEIDQQEDFNDEFIPSLDSEDEKIIAQELQKQIKFSEDEQKQRQKIEQALKNFNRNGNEPKK